MSLDCPWISVMSPSARSMRRCRPHPRKCRRPPADRGVAAILGAWAGDALGDRLGLEILTIGDFHLLAASIVAWIGIGISSAVAILGPLERRA